MRTGSVAIAALIGVATVAAVGVWWRQSGQVEPFGQRGIVVAGIPTKGYPEVVYGPSARCSGVIVGPDLMLTAGHCVFQPRAALSGVDGDVGTTVEQVSDCYTGVDIWKVNVSVKFMAPDAGDVKDGARMRLVGFGLPTSVQKAYADGKVTQQHCSIAECVFGPSWIGEIDKNKGSGCKGDSGGAGYTTTNGTKLAGIIEAARYPDGYGCSPTQTVYKLDGPAWARIQELVRQYERDHVTRGC